MFIIKLLLLNTDINLVIITLIESDYYPHKYFHLCANQNCRWTAYVLPQDWALLSILSKNSLFLPQVIISYAYTF